MVRHPRYVHTSLVARDWRALAASPDRVLGCLRVLLGRCFTEPVLEAATAVAGARMAARTATGDGHRALAASWVVKWERPPPASPSTHVAMSTQLLRMQGTKMTFRVTSASHFPAAAPHRLCSARQLRNPRARRGNRVAPEARGGAIASFGRRIGRTVVA